MFGFVCIMLYEFCAKEELKKKLKVRCFLC